MCLRATSQGLIYIVEVLDAHNQPLPSLTHAKTIFVIGTPGEPFHIRARVLYRNASPLARPKKPRFKVYARIDGESVGYSKLCSAADNISGGGGESNEAVEFRGRKVKEGWKSNFTFAPPESRMSGEPGKRPLPAAESLVGTILVRFKEAENLISPLCCQQLHTNGGVNGLQANGGRNEQNLPQEELLQKGGEVDPSTLQGGGKQRDAIVLDAEDQKFFTKPSLMAGSSQLLRSSAKGGHADLKVGGKYVHVDLECRFETAEVLLLRGILDPKVPAHLRMLETARAKARLSSSTSQESRFPNLEPPSQGNQIEERLRGETSSIIAEPLKRERRSGGAENAAAGGPLLEQLSVAGGSPRGENEQRREAEQSNTNCLSGEPCWKTTEFAEGSARRVEEGGSQDLGSLNGVQATPARASISGQGGVLPPENAPGSECPDWASDFRGNEFLRAPWSERTRGALAAAAREGKGPLSLSSAKRRAAELEGIHIEKRKKGAGPRQKVTIDLLDESRGDDLPYMAIVEKLPARVVPLN